MATPRDDNDPAARLDTPADRGGAVRRGLSLQQKLPLLIGGLLVGVMGLYSLASYKAVKDAALEVGRQRLVSLTDQLSKLYEQAAKDFGKSTRSLAADTSIRAFVASAGALARDQALDTLRRAGPRPENTIRVELLDANRKQLLTIPPSGVEQHEELGQEFDKAAVGPDFVAVGRLRLLNDTLVVPSVAAVLEGGKPIGYLVRWRRISSTAQARDQISKLLGGSAGLYLGNDRGDLWTDLVAVSAKPPVEVRTAPGRISEYARADSPAVVATAMAVPGTPWVALVEFSRASVMASADQFLRRAALLGAIVLLLGALLAWWLSRSITRPLGQLTSAATALASGDFTQAVPLHRADELGQLSAAFNTMAQRVGEAQHGLEAKVRDRTAQLQERNEELEAFAHSISHDLRAPLRAMTGFSQALLDDCGPQLGATGTDYARRVADGARRMDALIQDLLAYSRVSRAEMELSSVDLWDTMQRALTQLEGDLTASGGVVSVGEPLPAVIGHRATLEQVLVNLVANGLKFVRPGVAPAVSVRAEQADGLVRLWVEDNGIGIDPTHRERIFGVFERLHQSEDYPGTGIGLAIVRKGIERMGGRVGVESVIGRGSRFWIQLRPARLAS